MSEIGHELANQSGTFGLIYYIDSDNSVKCSLRSNGDYDISVMAKHFGGGGHKNAAGFTTDFETLKKFLS
jgi:nanoRNase/pAp phosphatase (c-di-AMP/oligoRNAs hydrolase)